MLRMMDTDVGITGPINIGNPGEYTMLELAETVLRLSRSNSRLVKRPLPDDDPKHRQPDISMARSLLAWEPAISLEDGLNPTIEYFRRLLKV
jgi:UDP-glucuronate decarboxylase